MFLNRWREKCRVKKAIEQAGKDAEKSILFSDALDEIDDELAAMKGRYCPVYQEMCPATERDCCFFVLGKIGKYFEGDEKLDWPNGWDYSLPYCSLKRKVE